MNYTAKEIIQIKQVLQIIQILKVLQIIKIIRTIGIYKYYEYCKSSRFIQACSQGDEWGWRGEFVDR